MYSLLTILIVILAVILILIVLVQNSKGGGLAANFASSNQIMGVRKTTDFLEKATWTLAIVIAILSIAAAWTLPRGNVQGHDSVLMENALNDNATNPETYSGFDVVDETAE